MGKFFGLRYQIANGKVINVSSCQTEGFRDGTRTSPGEKDHSCAFVIVQLNKSASRGAQLVPMGIPIHCWEHNCQLECTDYQGESGAFS